MAKFSENTITSWTKPASDTEETKLGNAERMVRDALFGASFSSSNLDLFGQGSYANDTNVRNNSDIDINACYRNTFYYELPFGSASTQFGILPPTYDFQQYKRDVQLLLENHFGKGEVVRNNKCITIKGNTYRIKTDVVPTWIFRRYHANGTWDEGVRFISDDNSTITSFPRQHIANGRLKNGRTGKRYKWLTRIFRKLRYQMIDDGLYVDPSISSFLLECLVWNVPDHIFINAPTWSDRLKEAISFVYHAALQNTCSEWTEVSGHLPLFNSNRKWSIVDVQGHMLAMWNYIEF